MHPRGDQGSVCSEAATGDVVSYHGSGFLLESVGSARVTSLSFPSWRAMLRQHRALPQMHHPLACPSLQSQELKNLLLFINDQACGGALL